MKTFGRNWLLVVILMGSCLQAMNPAMERQEPKEKKAYLKLLERLGLKDLPVNSSDQGPTVIDVAPTLAPLINLGLTQDEIIELITSWRDLGHQFPDERFDPYSVANAILKYAQAQGYKVPTSSSTYSGGRT